MKLRILSGLTNLLVLAGVTAAAQSKLPVAPSVPATDTYFGVRVTDPYRNLENLADPAVQAWMKAQAVYARQTLDAIPGRQKLLKQLLAFDARKAARVWEWKVADNDRYFYLKTRPQDQQPKLYCRQGYQGAEVLLFDPETYEPGKVYTINNFVPAHDGSKVAFVVSEKGAELGSMLVLDATTRKLYPEKIIRARSTGTWLPDNRSFTYLPFNDDDVKTMETRRNTQSLVHRVGTPQSQDRPVFSARLYPELQIKPEEYPFAEYDPGTRRLYGYVVTVERYLRVYQAPLADLSKPKIGWQLVCAPAQEITNLVGDDQYLYFVTAKNTPRQKIMRTLAAKPNVASAELLVPESPDEALNDEQLKVTNDGLYFVRTRNGVEAKLYFVAKGSKTIEQIKLPQPAGTLTLQAKNAQSPDLWVEAVGWTADRTRYRYSAATHAFVPEPLSSAAQYPEYADLVVEELMVPSHDGVLVPMSLVYKKGTPRDGTAPTLLYGYGAYAVSNAPYFSPSWLLWTQQSGILANLHVRGGGELGEDWHKAGQKTTKPSTWKDVIACAEYLVKERYTAPGRLALNGASAGGILVGRAMTERPDLFAAAVPQVGILNAVRMENSPNGPGNAAEFGTVQKEKECRALLEMDAYQHLQPGTKYPATLVTAGFHDPRVIAWQPAKFAARLQASNASGKPMLFFTDFEAGHGHGDAKQKVYESIADVLAFALWQTGAPEFQLNSTAGK